MHTDEINVCITITMNHFSTYLSAQFFVSASSVFPYQAINSGHQLSSFSAFLCFFSHLSFLCLSTSMGNHVFFPHSFNVLCQLSCVFFYHTIKFVLLSLSSFSTSLPNYFLAVQSSFFLSYALCIAHLEIKLLRIFLVYVYSQTPTHIAVLERLVT